MSVSGKWKNWARRTVAKRIAAELRNRLHKWPRSRRHDVFTVKASATYWQLVAEALEEVTKQQGGV